MSEGTAVEARKLESSVPSWRSEVWGASRQATVAIAVDVIIYCSCLLGLMICFLTLKCFQWMGYSEQRLALFELVHFWAYWFLNLLFVCDLVVKSALHLAKGWKNAQHDV